MLGEGIFKIFEQYNKLLQKSDLTMSKEPYEELNQLLEYKEKCERLEEELEARITQAKDYAELYLQEKKENEQLKEDAEKWRNYKELNNPKRYCKMCEHSIPEDNPSELCGPCYEYDRIRNS